jgi:serine/threonine-protein kinase
MLRQGETVGRFVIETQLGQGAMGSVYLALDPSLGRRVALKVLATSGNTAGERATAAARMMREARAVAAISHPNVVVIHDVGEVHGAPFIAMELVSGSTLRQLIGHASSDDKLRWLIDVARGLGAAHRAGLVHRDIKPDNVMVTPDGVVKVLDFGIARSVDTGLGAVPPLAALTDAGQVIGTPEYMSPEQLQALPIDGRSDQFAWGVTAYEVFAGTLPWGGKVGAYLFGAIMTGAGIPFTQSAPSMDRRIADVITRAMRTNPLERFGSMDELVDALIRPSAPPQLTPTLASRHPAPSSASPGRSATIGRYRIFQRIASGGMASVHFGRLVGEAGFSRTVAIKRLHPHLAEDQSFVATMIDEARLAARIHHPNVVPTLDVVSSDGELLVVMEYVRGESLARLLSKEADREGTLAPEIASAIAIGVLHGLHAAHEATSDQGEPLGIVHRDVSPQNVLVGMDGVARVIDFGVAKAAGRLQTTREGAIKGKIPYMAREQLASQRVTRAADIYAVGVVLWEMLTCQRLFHGDTDMAVIEQVQAGARQVPSQLAPRVSPALDAIVMKAIARDPGDRFPTALAMADELLRIVPPAFPTSVGAWCKEVAGESLAERARVLAEIESRSGVDGPPGGPNGDASWNRSTPPLDSGAVLASQPSSIALETPHRPLPRTSGAGVLLAALGGGTVVLAGLAVAAWIIQARFAPSRAAGSEVMDLPSASTGGAPPLPVASSSPGPQANPPPTGGAVPSVSHAAATVPTESASRPPRLISPPAAPNCNPPYVIDAQGHRVYKRACL